MWRYQRVVAGELLGSLGDSRFVVVMMPTGSGKTLLEVLVAWVFLRMGLRVLVLEPTRFLVDQAAGRVWRPILGRVEGGVVGSDYEGRCDVYRAGYRVVVSTPQTGLKCVDHWAPGSAALVVDEVHHAYSSKYYGELAARLRPEFLVGFTALVPRDRRLRLPEAILRVMGEPTYLVYDFAKLEKLGGYKAPKAILDIYDAELDNGLQNLYLQLYLNRLESVERRLQSFLANTLMRYGLDAYCESLRKAVEKGRLEGPAARELLTPCLRGPAENHKIKVLLDALTDYWDESIKPVIIFTSRVPTARRAAELVSGMALEDRQLRVTLLTGQAAREERLRIVKEARRGSIDVIVSTRVGEEGVDLPEAGMLVLLDTSTTPLRFYQRIGRLIRRNRRTLKHLVGIYTVGTSEYETLPVAVANLRAEGVDASYVIANLEEKGLYKALKNYLTAIMGDKKRIVFPELLTSPGRQKLDDALSDYLDGKINYREAYDMVKGCLKKARIYRETWKLVREGHLAYYLDPAPASEILAAEILASLAELVSKHGRGGDTYGDMVFAGGTLKIDLGEIFTILGSKPVQSAHSIVVPAENAVEEAERLASEIEAGYMQLGLPLSIEARRNVRKLSSNPRKTLWANLWIRVELRGDGALAENVSRYTGLHASPERLEFRFRIPRLKIYGFKELPPWTYYASLGQDGFGEVILDITRMRWCYPHPRGIEGACREDELPQEYVKLILAARSQILATLRALKALLEIIQA